MKRRFSQTCSAGAKGNGAYTSVPSRSDRLPTSDAAEAASVLSVLPVLLCALPVSGPLRCAEAGKNTVD